MTETGPDDQPATHSPSIVDQFTWGNEQDPDPPKAKSLWGKYRGTVLENQDPLFSGRLQVSVPGIVISNWAMPCVPLTDVMMGTFMRPSIGANVWVEFERGDPDKPIWVGCWWGEGQTPPMDKESIVVPPLIPVMTIEGATAGISVCDEPFLAGGDTPGNVNIVADAGAVTIALSPAGVSITAPEVTITATTFSVVTPAGGFTVA